MQTIQWLRRICWYSDSQADTTRHHRNPQTTARTLLSLSQYVYTVRQFHGAVFNENLILLHWWKSVFYWCWRFLKAVTTARLSHTIQSTPSLSYVFNIILPPTTRFIKRSLTFQALRINLYSHFFRYCILATFTAHLILFNFMALTVLIPCNDERLAFLWNVRLGGVMWHVTLCYSP